jgi:hypothetical protein
LLAEKRLDLQDLVYRDIENYGRVFQKGYFFISESEFKANFEFYSIAHNRLGYNSIWYDKQHYRYNNEIHYELKVANNNGDLYFMVHSYFEGMIPRTGCTAEDKVPTVTIKIYKGEWPNHISA